MPDMKERLMAPDRGTDPYFDEMADQVWQALTAAGNPEKVTEEQTRNVLFDKLVRFAGYKEGQHGSQDSEPGV